MKALFEHYLQISKNIFTTISQNRPQVSLYCFDEEIGAVKKLHSAGVRITKQKYAQLSDMGMDNRLFLSRYEFKEFAELLRKNLGLLLTEYVLNEDECGYILFQAMKSSLFSFNDQPTERQLADIENVVTILSEYVWIDPLPRMQSLFRIAHLFLEPSSNSVNAALVGLAIYLQADVKTATNLGMNHLTMGILLHDIGMHAILPSKIRKKGALLHADKVSVENHVNIGLNILNRIRVNHFIHPDVIRGIVEHHERMNGRGYPGGLKDEQISIAGRICAISDSYCAMLTNRPHAKAKEPLAAATELAKDHGYDSKYVKVLVQLVRDLDYENLEKTRVAISPVLAQGYAPSASV